MWQGLCINADEFDLVGQFLFPVDVSPVTAKHRLGSHFPSSTTVHVDCVMNHLEELGLLVRREEGIAWT